MGCVSSSCNGETPIVDHTDGIKTRYSIIAKTGDHKGLLTHANLYAKLINDKGRQSDEIHLDCTWKNNFDAGSTDIFPVKDLNNFGHINDLELWRSGLVADSWYCEWIKVEDNYNNMTYVFPINRWMSLGFKMMFERYDCQLPQFAKFSDQRRIELAEKRKTYAFVQQVAGLPCQVIDRPESEKFSNDYLWDIGSHMAVDKIDGAVINSVTSDWKSLDDMSNIYGKAFPVPEGMQNWRSDFEFGKQRLTGCNPRLIRLCTEIPENLAVTNGMLDLAGLTIEQAIEKKRLFIVDLKITQHRSEDDHLDRICSPIALFFVNDESNLLPVAIQLFQIKEDDNPVFLPTDDEYTWMLAKMWFNNADASYHQSSAHLGMTHLLVESFAVATHCCLSPSHPLFHLLAPHFLYLMAINDLALKTLLNPGGWVDKTMAVGRLGMFEITRRRFKSWQLCIDGTFPKELESRGLSDPKVLPKYYYRDDGLLLWNAIYKYVSQVVDGHYDQPENISGDFELQDWHRVLSSPVEEQGCAIQGIPGDGSFKTKEDITLTVASAIFTSSVEHAAVNFGQYDNYGFPPHYPASLNGEPPQNKNAKTEEEIFNALPDKHTTLSVMEITKVLSMKATNKLGDFEVQYQFDPIGSEAVKQFIEELKEVGETINKRNMDREEKYTYLYPPNVPNAISI
ncbi:polyunsaturated fatty acid 5-lipoxygenase-like [Antedon mediterranea]|uniref:polyunsaturated fatty acid 5-lipoxygenase-like n=1 Tax=Antedon mediterranea TaxID=105859 RepID=UPI003AF77CF6